MAGIVGGNAPACGDVSVRPERAGGVLPRPRADRAEGAVISAGVQANWDRQIAAAIEVVIVSRRFRIGCYGTDRD